MSRVEELAKKYCEGSSFEDACMEKPAYIAGYHQAEKDLKMMSFQTTPSQTGLEEAEKDNELTWEDIKLLDSLIDDVSLEEVDTMEDLYQEVLKRFKERKIK